MDLDLTFDVVYYIVGGHYNDRFQVIYTFLDWGKAPGKAMTVVVAILAIMVPLAHGMHVLVARYREKLRRDHPNWGWQVRRGRSLQTHYRADRISHFRPLPISWFCFSCA